MLIYHHLDPKAHIDIWLYLGKQAKEKKQKHGKKTKGGKHKDGIQGQVNEGRSFVKQLEITQHIVLVWHFIYFVSFTFSPITVN